MRWTQTDEEMHVAQLVTSADIETFFRSTRREAQGLLPQLIRRLIWAASPDDTILQFSMPSGDDIRLHGVDGTLAIDGNHPFAPTGLSVWEMGVSDDPETKANEDLKKRAAKAKGTLTDTTFVFVTSKVWAGKNTWAKAKRKSKTWKSVKVIDAQLLAEWLDVCPGVAAWFNSERGSPINSFDSLSGCWRRHINPGPCTPELVIGGRKDEEKKVRDWLASPTSEMRVRAESAIEVVRFVAAVAFMITRESALEPRVLFARTADSIHYIGALAATHAVVLTDPQLIGDFKAAQLPRIALLVPVATGPADVELPSLKRESIEKALVTAGYAEDAARRIATESRGSLEAVLWSIDSYGIAQQLWLQPNIARAIAPLILPGQWTFSEHPDHTAVARIVGRPYPDVAHLATEWSYPNGPMQVWGAVWDWRAWRACWEHLAPHLSGDHLRWFRATTVDVLSTKDPALELPADERWMAGIQGKRHPYSSALRHGLIRSLMMLSVTNGEIGGVNPRQLAAGIVRDVLDVNEPLARFHLLAQWLPDLAEAAPDQFFTVLERILARSESTQKLFSSNTEIFGPTSTHIYVLWALERLAWSPAYLSRALANIGRMAEADSRENRGNSPSVALFEILVPWHPQTAATVIQRLDSLRYLCRTVPAAGWACATSLVPNDYQTATSTARPQVNEWATRAGRATSADVVTFVRGLVPILTEMAPADPVRWTSIVHVLPNLMRFSTDLAAPLIAALRGLDTSAWAFEQRRTLWEALRDLSIRHGQYATADWAVGPEELRTLQQLEETFRITDPMAKHQWLFERDPELETNNDLDWEAEQIAIEAARLVAAREMLAQKSFEEVAGWASGVGDPAGLGTALVNAGGNDTDLWRSLESGFDVESTEFKSRDLAIGIARSLKQRGGDKWVMDAVKRMVESKGPAAAANLAIAAGCRLALWKFLSDLPEVAAEYWRRVNLFNLGIDDAEYAVPNLIKAGRRLPAVDLAGWLAYGQLEKRSPDDAAKTAQLCAMAMKELPDSVDPKNLGHLHMTLPAALDLIERDLGHDERMTRLIASWEWNFLHMICGSKRGAKRLLREIAISPDFFVELVGLIYKKDNQLEQAEESEVTQEEREWRRQLHEQAWWLLQEWRTVPGLDQASLSPSANDARSAVEDGDPLRNAVHGVVSYPELLEWVVAVRSRAEELKLKTGCDIEIGKILAYGPADEDGTWPCTAIRDCIEHIASEDVDSHMENEIENRRGIHSRGNDGSAERQLALRYATMGGQLAAGWPRTAAILRSVADSYSAQAASEDVSGKRREFHY